MKIHMKPKKNIKHDIVINAKNWGYVGIVYTPDNLEDHDKTYGPHCSEGGTASLVYYQGIINFIALQASEMELMVENTLIKKISKFLRRKR